MRQYRQLTSEERYAITTLRRQGYSLRGIARALDRAPSTISREFRRNRRNDGWYRAFTADERARRFGQTEWALVEACLQEQWSPEQIAGWFRRFGILRISHETIYRYVWEDRKRGGTLYLHLRFSSKQRRKRYGHYDSRGRLAGKRHISERSPGAENRSRVGHLEGDTHCILTLVDRKTGYLMIGKLKSRTVKDTNRRAIALIKNAPRLVRTVTVDHGTEFHGYKQIEAATHSRFFFATPYHSWERGTSENTNGLIRQYLPKRKSMAQVSQRSCSRIANKLNNRPRKRLGYRTPRECHEDCL